MSSWISSPWRHCLAVPSLRFLLLAAVCLPLAAGAKYARTEVLRFKLASVGGKDELSLQASVRQTFFRRTVGEGSLFSFWENAHSVISDIQAECRGQTLASDRITFYYPQSQSEFIDAGRVHRIEFPHDLKPSESVSYSYHQSFEAPAFFPLVRVPALDRLERLELIVEHPADCQVDFQVFNTHADLDPLVEKLSPTCTDIVFEHLPEARMLPCDPFTWTNAYVLARITRAGAVLNPCTPEAFTRWYLDYLGGTSTPSDQMRSLLAEELAQAPSNREKARILFDYVKSEIRYIADEGNGHAYMPHPCAEVLDKKWGDCKDKARLLTELAKLHGIPMHMVLLNTGPAPSFPEVNLNLFNHAICAMEDGDQLVFMDPTDPASEMGEPPAGDLLARALVLDPRHPRYAVIPAQHATPDLELAIAGELSALDRGKARLILRHHWRARLLLARKDRNDKDFESYLRTRFEGVLARLPLEGFHILEEDREKVVLEADADLSEFLVLNGERVYAPTVPFRVIDPELVQRAADPYPVNASGPANYRMELTLTGPGALARPERIHLGDAWGAHCTATAGGTEGRVRLTFAVEQPFRVVPAPARAAFLAFCDLYLKSNQRLFTLQRHP